MRPSPFKVASSRTRRVTGSSALAVDTFLQIVGDIKANARSVVARKS
jgi:hypothetical protein